MERQMASMDTVFCRLLLKAIHKDVRKTFPEIRNVVKCVGVTSTGRGMWFVQINTARFPTFNFDCRAYSAIDARYKAWGEFMRKYGPAEAAQ
jgi:hypothetical protein